jgi:nucleotide-binding universal stress UspA family protein
LPDSTLEEEWMYKIVLVPLDGSKCAESILPHVESIAKAFESQLILLRVVDHAPDSVTTTASQIRKEDFDSEQEDAENYLDKKADELRGKGLNARTLILYGAAVKSIIEAAQEEKVDLITMGSHGRSGISQAFYGSVAAGVLNRVDRPLLLVRPTEC